MPLPAEADLPEDLENVVYQVMLKFLLCIIGGVLNGSHVSVYDVIRSPLSCNIFCNPMVEVRWGITGDDSIKYVYELFILSVSEISTEYNDKDSPWPFHKQSTPV